MSDKWIFIKWYVPDFKRKTTYLYGEISDSGKGALLTLKIKPNPVISIFPILTLVIGFVALIMTYQNEESLIFGLITVAVGVLFYFYGMLLRIQLQNNFKTYLDLQNV